MSAHSKITVFMLALVGAAAILFIGKALRQREPGFQGKTATAWIQSIRSASFFQKDPALDALIEIGPAAVPFIARALEKKDSLYAKAFFKLQPKVRIPRVFPRPVAAREIRKNATKAAGFFGPIARSALPELFRALNDADAEVRYGAALAIVHVRPEPATHLPLLKEALEISDPMVRRTILWAIEWMGPPAVEAVPAILDVVKKDGTQIVQLHAIRALAKIGKDSADARLAITRELSNRDATLRSNAAHYLQFLGTNAATATPELIGSLADTNENVRMGAVTTLGKIGQAARAALPRLTELFHAQETNLNSRLTVAIAVGNIAPGSISEVLPLFLNTLVAGPAPDQPQFGDPRFRIVMALGELGPAATNAVSALAEMMHSSTGRLQVATAETVWRITRDANVVRPVLRKALEESPSVSDRLYAIDLLRDIDGDLDAVLPILISSLRSVTNDNDGNAIAYRARQMLLKTRDQAKPALPAVVQAIKQGSQYARTLLGGVLFELDPETAARVGITRRIDPYF